jgi:hypothetical protein
MTDEADGNPVLCRHLRREDGRCLGVIVRYYWDAPAYARRKSRCGRYLERVGVCSSDQAARARSSAGSRWSHR